MDPASLIVKKTAPADLRKNKKAIETLIAKDKAALGSFRQKPMHMIPFTAFEDVLESTSDEVEEKSFLQCAYNHSDKAYRSPWTNRYYSIKRTKSGDEDIAVFEKAIPPEEQGVRSIEYAANEVWDVYTQLYYGKEGVGSAFLKPRDKGSFEGIFGIHKRTDAKGAWDSVHVVQVDEPNQADKTCNYRVESAVVVSLDPYKKTRISCSLTKETVKTCKVRFSGLVGSHLENLGQIMEAVEIEFRSKLERVDIPKSMEVMESIYRKSRGSGTVHLMTGMNGDEASMASGMGIGAGLIGEIANKAKSKQGRGANPFMDAMQVTLKAREAKKKDIDEVGEQLVDMKKTLKKSTNPVAAEAMAKKKFERNAGSGYNDMRAGLKKASTAPKSPPPASTSPSTEFMGFRNKLKKTGRK